MGADVIFLSDTRIPDQSCAKKIQQSFNANCNDSYEIIWHSTKNSRGVAILVSRKLNFEFIDEFKDNDENILCLKCKINGLEMLLFSVYGPNNNDTAFFDKIGNILDCNPGLISIMGGDWNFVNDTNPTEENLDVINMQSLPNPANSKRMNLICKNNNLIDPYRVFYPENKEFTYHPFGTIRQNRSRLDFFYVSSDLINFINKVEIGQSMTTRHFDHRPVKLQFMEKKPQTSRGILKNLHLNDKIIEFSTILAAYEVNYFSIEVRNAPARTRQIRAELNRVIPVMKNLISEAIGIRMKNPDPDGLLAMQYAGKITEMEILISEAPGFEELDIQQKNCTECVFFEALTNRIKSQVGKFQKKLTSSDKMAKQEFERKLKQLKSNYADNFGQIQEIENKLQRLIDNEMKQLVLDSKTFECLNNEKANQHFLNMAKIRAKEVGLEIIKKENGEDFNSKEEREDYIKNFWGSLYTKENLPLKNLSIAEYLGRDIVQDPIVKNSILTEEEKNRFEIPISLDELDIAMEKANKKSAPGIDGYPCRFIYKFWHIFRKPLQKCMNESFRTGHLPDSFRTAVIKLLPKKGDVSKMKNWRPISLLSNFYKIISRAINNRLNTITGRILSRAQKGFTKNRQCHEVLINIDEKIEFCRRHNIKGCIVAVDQHKAFDSVDKEFMTKTLEFFGFGPNFIRMIETIGNHRRACIKLEGDRTTEMFEVSKGNTQGDCPSPVLYNFVAQLLLFKIELNPLIKSVTGAKSVNNVHQEIDRNDIFGLESNNETDNNESFADDSNTVTIFEYESLAELKRILEEFRQISGLKCNFEKTSILRIGNTDNDIDERILNLGFEIVDRIKLLGFYLTKNGIDGRDILHKITESIVRSIRFWRKFYLSLPGKIMITKTLMISQLSYYVTIWKPEDNEIIALQNLIDNFCTEGLNVSNDRKYRPVGEGGLGLIPIKEYIIALQVSWIKRGFNKAHDNWSSDLKNLGGGEILHITEDDVRDKGPVIKSIVNSYQLFKEELTKTGQNYTKIPIIHNKSMKIGQVRGNLINRNTFNDEEWENYDKIRGLTFSDFRNDNQWKTRNEVIEGIRMDISEDTYRKIIQTLTDVNRKFSRQTGKSVRLQDFFSSFKKGTKKIRLIMTQKYKLKENLNIKLAVNHFRIVNLNVPDLQTQRIMYGAWACNKVNNIINTFNFKLMGNTLGVGSRVVHINRDRDPGCTFCTLSKDMPVPLENIEHIFWNCPRVNKLIENLTNFYFGFKFTKEEWFGLNFNLNLKNLALLNIVLTIFKFVIWNNKLRKKLPNENLVISEINFQLNIMYNSHKKTMNQTNTLFQNLIASRRG